MRRGNPNCTPRRPGRRVRNRACGPAALQWALRRPWMKPCMSVNSVGGSIPSAVCTRIHPWRSGPAESESNSGSSRTASALDNFSAIRWTSRLTSHCAGPAARIGANSSPSPRASDSISACGTSRRRRPAPRQRAINSATNSRRSRGPSSALELAMALDAQLPQRRVHLAHGGNRRPC